jgi:streptogramin lyase
MTNDFALNTLLFMTNPPGPAGAGRGDTVIPTPPRGGQIMRPDLRHRWLLIVTLLALSISPVGAQQFTEFALDGSPSRIALGSDGALWFTIPLRSTIGRISPVGLITEFPLPGHNFAFDITPGPDGNLWFTQNVATIGSITTSGVVREFDIPWTPVYCGLFCTQGDPQPGRITAGPDGNLWFIELGIGKIGRITTDGVITEFPTRASPRELGEMAVASDGALWFTRLCNKIGRITTTGLLTEFTYTSPFCISSITAGPDGALWLAGSGLGRMTLDGVFTEFPLPGSGSSTGFITSGPDGNIWFTTSDSKIGRLTTAGVLTEFTVPSGDARFGGITSDRDGALWFTENIGFSLNNGWIGKITTSSFQPVLPNPTHGHHSFTVPFR